VEHAILPNKVKVQTTPILEQERIEQIRAGGVRCAYQHVLRGGRQLDILPPGGQAQAGICHRVRKIGPE
jgi:hypothetical protein